jgi:cystathionine gamma-synthase
MVSFPNKAVSVSLPRWSDNVGYEEGDPRIIAAMKGGYPRFVFHPHVKQASISFTQIFDFCRTRFAADSEDCIVLSCKSACTDCREFMRRRVKVNLKIQIVEFIVSPSSAEIDEIIPTLHILVFPAEYKSVAKEYWQHTGLGISSRFAEYCLIRLRILFPALPKASRPQSGSTTKYFKNESRHHDEKISIASDQHSADTFVEERFGRNWDMRLAVEARCTLRKRIAGVLGDYRSSESSIVSPSYRGTDVNEEHVKLFSCGMSAIYFAHQVVRQLFPLLKTVQFGFPYIDTLKIQEKFGSGVHFYGNGDSADLEALKVLLKSEKIAAIFCEFPSNPLLRSPPLEELWSLAMEHHFCLVVDDTIGNFVNTSVLPYCHVIVSSLTKVFSGDSNVMGGSLVLNPNSNLFTEINCATKSLYEDVLWFEDVIFLERNSRTFRKRIHTINLNTEVICDTIRHHPKGFPY